jgi:hypothetical protein
MGEGGEGAVTAPGETVMGQAVSSSSTTSIRALIENSTTPGTGGAIRAIRPGRAGHPSPAGAWLATSTARVLGALLLLGALDPARWPAGPCPQWFFGAAAVGAGVWAGPSIVDRPVLASHRWQQRLRRHRNTVLAAAAALLAALQSPPAWLMAVEVILLLGYLTLVDSAAAVTRRPRAHLGHALYAAAASVLVLLAALAPVTGGGWARFAAAAAALGTLALLYAALRLRRPASYARRAADTVSARPTAPRR